MKHKFILLILLTGLLIVFSVQNTLALGIAPGRTTLNFEPHLQKNVEFSVINSEHKEMDIKFSVRGDLSKYVHLRKKDAKFSSSDDSKSFIYEVNLPTSFSPEPGIHEAEIIALEAPNNLEEEGAFVGATVSVITQLHIYVPYPDKYVETAINVIESGEEGNTIFLIPVVSRGKLDINDLKVVVDIYSSANEKIASIESDSVFLGSLKRKEFVLEWPVNVSSGTYRAVAKIIYDGKSVEKEIGFNVGKMALEIKEIIIKDFQLGGVAKFDALVENKWSSDLKNVYLNILVYNPNESSLADFKSQTYDLNALDTQRMVAYWDTENVNSGTYEGKLILKYGKYGEKSIDRNVKIKVSNYDIEVFGLTGHAITRNKGIFNLNNILIILIVILIIGNLIWFLIVKRMKKRRKY